MPESIASAGTLTTLGLAGYVHSDFGPPTIHVDTSTGALLIAGTGGSGSPPVTVPTTGLIWPVVGSVLVSSGAGGGSELIITSDVDNVDEGDTVTFTLTTDPPLPATDLAWQLSGVSSADVVGGALNGIVTTNGSGIATVAVEIVEDELAEGEEAMTMIAGIASAVSDEVLIADTSDGYVAPTALLHFDGTDGATTFTDSSTNNWTVTTFGNAALTTADPVFGSAWLDLGTTGYISLPADSAFAIGTNDFTIDFWIKPNRTNGNDGVFTFGGSFSGLALSLYFGNWLLTTTGAGGNTMGAATTDRQHGAITRSGTHMRMFVDGTQIGPTLVSSANLTDNQLKIGYYYDSHYRAQQALIDEFRFINGTAIWTSNFTPPSAPYSVRA